MKNILPFIYSVSIGFICILFTFIAEAGLYDIPTDRIYVLNSSDFVFRIYRDAIRQSRRFAGNYVKRYQFPEFKMAEYFLKKGETLHAVAVRLGISVDSIASASGINFLYGATNGQRVLIPNFQGVYLRNRKGLSVKRLALKYNIKGSDIMRFNALKKTYIPPGKDVFVPGAVMPAVEQAFFYGTAFKAPLPRTVLTSHFGLRSDPITGKKVFHGGIDLAAPTGTGVRAAHYGTVEYAGRAGGYGLLVVIRHPFGYRTFYGHLSKISVKTGQKINAGNRIGSVGSTGRSTGPHLHFEIRHYDKKVNPAAYADLNHNGDMRLPAGGS